MPEKKYKNCRIHGVLEEKDILSWQTAKSKKTGKKTLFHSCRMCNREKLARYRKNNTEKVKNYWIEYRKKNKPKQGKHNNRWGKSEKGKQYFILYNEKIKNNLDDIYVRKLLRTQLKLKRSEIPSELVDLKRNLLKLKRLIEEKNK